MNCRELRKQVDFMLDTEQPHALTNDMAEHIGACEKCAAYAHAMEEVDGALRRLRDPDVSEEVARRLRAIPLVYKREGLIYADRADFWRTTIYLVPAATLAIFSLTMLPTAQGLIFTAIAALAFAALAFHWIRRTSGRL